MTSEQTQIRELLDKNFSSFSDELKDDISAVAQIVKVEAGNTMMEIGGFIKSVPLVYEGDLP
ncbi:MAG: hypothetical protein HKN32_05060 [Flavobacteriales bacterium]|nr:hypothetical protein [Flavobacteriales bacterium]